MKSFLLPVEGVTLKTCFNKPDIVWGGVCFLLLYRTFPEDVDLWWDVISQWNVPVWQQIVTWSTGILPSLIPICCYIYIKKMQISKKLITVSLPLIFWLLGRFILVAVLWIITFKLGHQPPYSNTWTTIFSQQLVHMYLTSHILVSALTIVTCSYAFWREKNTFAL